MNEAVSFLFQHSSRKRFASFLDHFGVDAESVETTPRGIRWRSSIDSLGTESLGRLMEAAEEILLLASEPELVSTQWASFLCGDAVWDVWYWPGMSNIEKILDLWLTNPQMFQTAYRINKRRAVPPSLITPDMAY